MSRNKIIGNNQKVVFAKRNEEGDAMAEAEEKRDHWQEVCDSLIANPCFKEWFTEVTLRYGGIELDRIMTDAAQGQMLMFAKLRDSLRCAKGAPKFFGDIMAAHYNRLTKKGNE